ncbi:surfeit locus protein [Seminavis robusta]|uniref:Surfeit locus protein n=1 Tax=Seminavis robusta TaxID=568900 RepID=A0A9N8EM70_9STRA|nr:surfeit locus protein [Seminavis robusta]|eukprot:Sro1351_g265250.1 surfeit locus protein (400) ;mRNA; r:16963-18162
MVKSVKKGGKKETKLSKKEDDKTKNDKPQRWVLADLQDHNAFFDSLVDMIPSKLYIAGNSGDDYNPKYYKGQHKENREARRAQQKASKRAKYDPSQSESTVQTKKRLEEEKEGDNGVMPVMPTKADKKNGVVANGVVVTDNKSRIEALRAKLHAKIAEKSSNRPTDPSVVSKRAARRSEKQRRKEEAMKKKKSASSKVHNNGKNDKYTMAASTSTGADPARDLEQIDFGRLTGLNAATPNYKNNKALANLSTGKNLEKILADAEEKRLKLEELKRSDNPEDKEQLTKIQWSDALKEASGERVKDDPAKLKNKLKRKAAKKAKSQKAWKSRLDQTQQKMDERQKIRSHNLDKRKMGGKAGSNLSKKRIEEEATTKGRLRPGFEGKSHSFLNEGKKKPTQQ